MSTINVKALRKRVDATQPEFSARLGVPLGTLRNWEQMRNEPSGPAKALLAIIERALPAEGVEA